MRICLEQSAFPGVIRVTEKVAHDVELVSGKKPQILVEKEIPETLESSGEDWTIIAATKGKSSFLKKLEEAGSAELKELEQKREWVLDDRHIETGKIDTVNMLQIPKNMLTVFVRNCDLTASLLIKKLRENGYRVPEDISVVGFDNYLYPGLSDIRITTYEVDMGEMARRALHNMIKKITSDNYKSGVTVVEGRLVLKDSVSHV